METLPLYIAIIMALATCLAVYAFYKATNHSKYSLVIILGWIIVQGLVSSTGFYEQTGGLPPRFMLLVVPPFLLIAVLFSTARGRRYIDSLNLKFLMILHIIRIPVELVLFWLFLHKTVPQLMTFEGRNFDIISGLTALPVLYFGLIKNTISRKVVLLWNFICLGLLINIVAIAFLSAPFQFQQLALDQPNVAVLSFPFVWLPCCIVPLVLLSHLAAIRQLLNAKQVAGKSLSAGRVGELQ